MKPNLSRTPFLFLLGIIAILGQPLLSSSYGSTRPLPVVKAIDNPCLKFFPRDAWLIGNVDLKAFFDFMSSGAEENPVVDMMLAQYAEMFRGFTGIDFTKEVRYLTFCLVGDDLENLQGLVVVKGSFNSSVAEMRLTLGIGAQLARTTYRGKTLYSDGVSMGYVFPETSTFVIGSPSLLRRAVDVLDTQAQPMSSYLRRTLAKTNGASIVWVAGRPEVVLETNEVAAERRRNPELFARMSAVQSASLFSEAAPDGLLITALGCAADRQRAQDLYSFLTNSKRNALDVDGANVFLGSFLVMSDIAVEEDFVRWDLQLTERALERLWETRFVRKIRGGIN